jgi:CRISPR/Cas system Type II protein with McrA/HNH and RuvC-like nuclease domain
MASNSPKTFRSRIRRRKKKLYRFTTVQKNKFYFRAGFFMRCDEAVKSRISAGKREG